MSFRGHSLSSSGRGQPSVTWWNHLSTRHQLCCPLHSSLCHLKATLASRQRHHPQSTGTGTGAQGMGSTLGPHMHSAPSVSPSPHAAELGLSAQIFPGAPAPPACHIQQGFLEIIKKKNYTLTAISYSICMFQLEYEQEGMGYLNAYVSRWRC